VRDKSSLLFTRHTPLAELPAQHHTPKYRATTPYRCHSSDLAGVLASTFYATADAALYGERHINAATRRAGQRGGRSRRMNAYALREAPSIFVLTRGHGAARSVRPTLAACLTFCQPALWAWARVGRYGRHGLLHAGTSCPLVPGCRCIVPEEAEHQAWASQRRAGRWRALPAGSARGYRGEGEHDLMRRQHNAAHRIHRLMAFAVTHGNGRRYHKVTACSRGIFTACRPAADLATQLAHSAAAEGDSLRGKRIRRVRPRRRRGLGPGTGHALAGCADACRAPFSWAACH